eukprot:TRINITY_DN7041_c0_g1_i4.p1 TRINITY_DN7041_c0_g1~~TRINITY_DN7041_c0_g1_i4.p1  ORF type:complete len:215 (-),score=28.20 TRINITY_DN7041_c0_g1_i4:350-994(-)
MVADRALYEGEDRTTILRCHALCRRSNYAMMLPAMRVKDVEDASRLARPLQNAHRSCRAHRKASGLGAQVLLGSFDLEESSSGTKFRCGADARPSMAGLPPGILEVNLLLDGVDKLMACATYKTCIEGELRPLARANRMRVVADVQSLDTEKTLFFRGVSLALDGSWQTSMIGRARRGEHSRRALLCVLTVMEGGYTKKDVSFLQALNVEISRA